VERVCKGVTVTMMTGVPGGDRGQRVCNSVMVTMTTGVPGDERGQRVCNGYHDDRCPWWCTWPASV